MSKIAQEPSEPVDFWSMSYRGQEIAVQYHYSGWLVYLNKVCSMAYFSAMHGQRQIGCAVKSTSKPPQ